MLEKTYDPTALEARHYSQWEQAGAFEAHVDSNMAPYTIMMPPPNVTGSLHMGHALTFTLQDILIRYHRKAGRDALWQPGMDHAGIATQMVVERQLSEKGVDRRDLGRDRFVDTVWEWKAESGGMIMRQLRSLGATADWRRERFTMDEGLSAAVTRVFVDLHRQGLIYRDKRLVNWDPVLLTAISDLEVQQVEVQGSLWYFRYPIEGEPDRFITVATTRPETMLGDTGVAVHPDDPRYRDLVGRNAVLPLVGRVIPIVADEYSDMEKGTGAVKMTPAHDFNDFEVGRRHGLELVNIFDRHARLNDAVPEPYRGLDRYEAREQVISDMEALGLLEKVESTVHAVPHGDRSGAPLEPWLTDQWYCDAATLARPAIEAVEDGRTRFVPKNWENTYFEWMRNIQPWCISRQLWWGHQIPAWYGPDGTVFVEQTEQEARAAARAHYGEDRDLVRDEDVLDTWFSSALWPFSTLGWPERTGELGRYYPGDVLVTGFDIIFFWVARMMMMGMHFMNEVPFHTVYIHALVRDQHGQKMSKSKGNVMDPLDLVATYGTDALRFTLAAMAAQGRDIKLAEGRIQGYRNFATKLWNATRYAMMNGCAPVDSWDPAECSHTVNRWIVGETARVSREVAGAIESYRFNEAAGSVYRFCWNIFCDWYLEFTKPLLAGENEEAAAETRATSAWVLQQMLNVLNPLMPYLTEELWERLGGKAALITTPWPDLDRLTVDAGAAHEMDWVIRLITEVRSIRSEMNVPPRAEVDLFLEGASADTLARLDTHRTMIMRLARLASISPLTGQVPHGAAQSLLDEATLVLPLADIIDLDRERTRLSRDLAKARSGIAGLRRKLANPAFRDRAPREVLDTNRQRLAAERQKREQLKEALRRLGAA
ncbi:MAG: valine--tRNA ligase [Alphaproteobacteria bacterium]|nr:valine--tRNA ligase [Alphaproteobacteria bacterium]